MNTNNDKYFFCYSPNLYHKIKSNNLCYITKGNNPSNNKTFWVFEKTDILKQILIKWTKQR